CVSFMRRPPPTSTLFPYTTLFRSRAAWTCRSGWGRLKPQGFPRARASGRPVVEGRGEDCNGMAKAQKGEIRRCDAHVADETTPRDRKSTRLNSSHLVISYAVFCLK